MTLIRWQPFREIDTLQRQINRLFDDSFTPSIGKEWREYNYIPAAEIEETEEAIHLKLELPGINIKDLDVQVTREAVSITGERKKETKTEEKGVKKTEFFYGKFERVIPLPSLVKNDNVTAEYKDGVLNLILPKREEEKNKVVKVNLEQS